MLVSVGRRQPAPTTSHSRKGTCTMRGNIAPSPSCSPPVCWLRQCRPGHRRTGHRSGSPGCPRRWTGGVIVDLADGDRFKATVSRDLRTVWGSRYDAATRSWSERSVVLRKQNVFCGERRCAGRRHRGRADRGVRQGRLRRGPGAGPLAGALLPRHRELAVLHAARRGLRRARHLAERQQRRLAAAPARG